ncbi:MAG: DUF1559 domain-containing protein [Planctomycetota bacterium]|nr:DUF1559 domain-containing protein [Planctomycetota bacterium]
MEFNRIQMFVLVLAASWTSNAIAPLQGVSQTTAQDSPTDKYLGDTGGVVFEVSKEDLLKSKDYRSLVELMDLGGNFKRQFGFSIGETRHFAGSVSGPDDAFLKLVLQSSRDIDPLAFMRANGWVRGKQLPETRSFRDQTYYEINRGTEKIGVFQPTDQSVVVNRIEVIEEMVRGRKPEQELLRSKDWLGLEDFQLKFAIGDRLFEQWREEYQRFNSGRSSSDPILDLVGPINEKIVRACGGLKLDGQLNLRISLFAKTPSAAGQIKTSLEALVQIGETMLGPDQAELIEGVSDPEMQKITREGMAFLDDLIESLEFKRLGRELRITARADAKSFVRNVLPDSIQAARKAAQRTQSMNNMKQLGLSMHNYHDTHKGFPPAVLIGPKGHRHSWRIAVLPYLGEMELYEQYRLDEPWDSPNNQKVMNRMPEVFRHPTEPDGSVNTRYLAFVGPKSPFSAPDGFRFSDLTDGSSNTIMFFSGATQVPWTKPEDIEYDPEQEIPLKDGPFEKGFNAVFFDGSVQFIPSETGWEKLHLLIQGNDGQPVER